MTTYQITFSNQFKLRLYRHLFFWFCYFLYTLLINLPAINFQTLTDTEFYKSVLTEATAYLPLYLISVYLALYYILPKYLANRNLVFLLVSLIALFLLTITSSYLITKYFIFRNTTSDPQDILTVSMIKGISEQIIITGSALIIKISKDYYLRDEEYQKLRVQRIYNQLEMMKMKIEPSIFLSVLKNIHSDIKNDGGHAPQMIILLSDLLSYILYETDVKLVPLKREINMLKNYTSLKELIYGQRLQSAVQITGVVDNQLVAPLVLLPFIELAIPQETDDPTENIISEINIELFDSRLRLKTKNNLLFPDNENHGSKTIVKNALLNLHTKYPGGHTMHVDSSAGGLTTFLELKLISIPVPDEFPRPVNQI